MPTKQSKDRQDELLSYIEKYRALNGFSPCSREMVKDTSIPSTSIVHYYLDKMEEEGQIIRTKGKSRSVVPVGKNGAFTALPWAKGHVPPRGACVATVRWRAQGMWCYEIGYFDGMDWLVSIQDENWEEQILRTMDYLVLEYV